METDLLWGRHVDPSSGRERFGVFAERWLEARDLRPRTRDTYASQLAHILDELEPVELRKITPSAVRAWHGRLSKSGLRYGELTGLTRRHVDIEGRSLRVDQALSFVKGQGPTPGPPKSAAAHRTVVIPGGVAELLAAHIEEHVAADPDALVFTLVKDSPRVNRYFAPYWKKALTEAGIDESIRFHDLRHHAATSAATAGASLREIMARMGHASSDASLRYLNASARRDEEIADAMERRMAGELERQPNGTP